MPSVSVAADLLDTEMIRRRTTDRRDLIRIVVRDCLMLAGFLLGFLIFFATSGAGKASAATCTGTDGPDTIYCSNGADTIDGLAGNDELHGMDGNDTMYGRAGQDGVYGEGHKDTLRGGDGNCCSEFIVGGGDNDTIYEDSPGGDWDFACGKSGNDIITVQDGDGNDYAAGGTGTDSVSGDPGLGDALYEGDNVCPP
jgi:Ca2+-binding RTX toxin-like protein